MQSEEIVQAFFFAYQRHDDKGMQAMLSQAVHFVDFAFDISGQDVFAMWRLFCLATESRAPVEVQWYRIISASSRAVTADYRVAYVYGKNKRPVDYVIRANFTIVEGKIVEHRDHGSIFTWAWQAIGPLPALISWTLVFRRIVARQARKTLDDFIRSGDMAHV
jgi:hypothetical protein